MVCESVTAGLLGISSWVNLRVAGLVVVLSVWHMKSLAHEPPTSGPLSVPVPFLGQDGGGDE